MPRRLSSGSPSASGARAAVPVATSVMWSSFGRRTRAGPPRACPPGRGGRGARGAPAPAGRAGWCWWSRGSGDAGRGAGLLQRVRGADLRGGGVAVVADRLDVRLGDQLRLEQDGLHVGVRRRVLRRAGGLRVGRGGVALGERDRERGGGVGLLLHGLVD